MSNFGLDPLSISNSERIIYKGFIYETSLKVNSSIDNISKYLMHEILKSKWTNDNELIMNVTVLNNDEETTKVKVIITKGTTPKADGYGELYTRNDALVVIKLPKVDMITEQDYNSIKEVLIHEFLHVIDPKKYNKEINEKFEYLGKDDSHNQSQILEREQYLSAKAKVIIDYLTKNNKDIKSEIQNNFDTYFKTLPRTLQTPNERKVFAKLLYFYMEN